ncbi:hypothetical protein CVD28_13645 [Bacillus sp. M6-12]|uniref:DinB family protein n=1 Tax=Bacillus sp. M6-12 TaxID=2054166 RepID=UPI000C75863E|nr:DinB family protein [Bacillus sp. M6-12]PLS17093.1 hypothetical protein CVD28_13645 [Bacillus sp. M6-12]
MKNEVTWIEKYEQFNVFVISLKDIPADLWLCPIKEGKWSIGEIVSHFYYWEKFILEERLQKFLSGEKDFVKPDVELMNQAASEFAKSGASRETIINLFTESRSQIAALLTSLPAEVLDCEISFGSNPITIRKYIIGFEEHDQHHKRQIEEFLQEKASGPKQLP